MNSHFTYHKNNRRGQQKELSAGWGSKLRELLGPFFITTQPSRRGGLPRRHHYRCRHDMDLCGDLTPRSSLLRRKTRRQLQNMRLWPLTWYGRDRGAGGTVLFPRECNASGSERTTLKERTQKSRTHPLAASVAEVRSRCNSEPLQNHLEWIIN